MGGQSHDDPSGRSLYEIGTQHGQSTRPMSSARDWFRCLYIREALLWGGLCSNRGRVGLESVEVVDVQSEANFVVNKWGI